MRGLSGSQAFYYLQTLLTGDNETGRKSRTFHMLDRYEKIKNELNENQGISYYCQTKRNLSFIR